MSKSFAKTDTVSVSSNIETDELSTSRNRTVRANEADVTLKLLEEHEKEVGDLTPELEARLKRKLWFTIVPVVFAVNYMLFFDKNAMGYANLLGMFEDLDLDQQKYNDLQTIFYAGYVVFQLPSHLIFQRIPMSWYISGATFVWALTTLTTLAAKNFSHMCAIRFILGCFESGVTPALEHTIAMWFTPSEQAIVNPIFWISCLAQGIPAGLLAYGVEFVDGTSPWKVYWSILGGLSFVLSVSALFFFPDNPATYRFFTIEERVHVIKRIKAATNSSIEQKQIKKHQVVEALKDPITWLFGVFIFLNMLCNNISFQSTIIYKQLGVSTLGSTLVSVASAGWCTALSLAGSVALVYFREQTAHVSTVFCGIALLGGLMAALIPLSDSRGILAGIFLTNANGVTFIAAFSWCQATAAGYSKRLVRTVIWSVFYGCVNIAAPQIWRSQDAPRYHMAWGIMIAGSWFLSPLLLQVIRFILSRRNKERKLHLKEEDYGFVTTYDEQGNEIKNAVDVSMLDLTDLENKRFIYPL